MSRVLHRQLIGHEDFALGHGKVIQTRGPETLEFQQIELEFIFRTVDEIKELDYNVYTHVAIHVIGPVIQYYYDPTSHAVPNDTSVIKPNSVHVTQGGRYIRTSSGIFDTIIASASDENTPLTIGGPKTTFRSPYPMNLSSGYVRISLTTAPTGAPLIVRLTMNGAELFSTNVQIDASLKTSVGSETPAVLAITDIPDDAEYLVYITQVGSTIAGTGLKVAVTGVKV